MPPSDSQEPEEDGVALGVEEHRLEHTHFPASPRSDSELSRSERRRGTAEVDETLGMEELGKSMAIPKEVAPNKTGPLVFGEEDRTG